jgi:hypothetical protein
MEKNERNKLDNRVSWQKGQLSMRIAHTGALWAPLLPLPAQMWRVPATVAVLSHLVTAPNKLHGNTSAWVLHFDCRVSMDPAHGMPASAALDPCFRRNKEKRLDGT